MEFFPDMEDKIYMQDQDLPGIKEVLADMDEEIDIQYANIAGIDEEFVVNDYNKPKDGLVRRVGISFKNKGGDDHEGSRHSVVERPARACVKLMNIEDTSILDDMRKVRKSAEEILKDKFESDAITD